VRWHLVKNSKLAVVSSFLAVVGLLSPASAMTTVQSQVCEDFLAPAIVSPSDGTQTTEASAMIEGTGEPGKTVAIMKDDVSQGVATIASDGSFGFTVTLEQGDNELVARETNECGTAKDSPAITIIADLPVPPVEEPTTPAGNPPASNQPEPQPSTSELGRPITRHPSSPGFEKPVITLPGDGAVVYSDTFLMEGTAYPGSLVTVYVNDKSQAQVVSSSRGVFRVRIVLEQGQDVIKVLSTYAGKSAISDTVTVTYIKKVTAVLTRPLSSNEIATTAVTAGAAVTGGAAVAVAINWSLHKSGFKLKFWRRK